MTQYDWGELVDAENEETCDVLVITEGADVRLLERWSEEYQEPIEA